MMIGEESLGFKMVKLWFSSGVPALDSTGATVTSAWGCD